MILDWAIYSSLPITTVPDFTSISGELSASILATASSWILRSSDPDAVREFRTPGPLPVGPQRFDVGLASVRGWERKKAKSQTTAKP